MNEQLYAYRFADPTGATCYTNAAQSLVMEGEVYTPSSLSHSTPTFSSDPSQARITVTMADDLVVALNYISHPPPWTTELRIWEVLETSASGNQLQVTEAHEHWTGKVVRVAWRDSFRVAVLTCKTRHDIHFARETMQEGLNPLCRFHIGDGRCPVNIEDFKESATVTGVSGDVSEPTITVASLVQADNDYYKAGMIRLADTDMRIVDLVTNGTGSTRILTLSRAFPSTSVQIGDTVEVFAGDDLTQETCTVIFGAATDSGAAWGGWKLTPNRDYARDGLI